MQYPCKAFGLLSKKQYAPNAEIRFMIKLLTDLWRECTICAVFFSISLMVSLSDNEATRRLRLTPLLSSSKFPAFSASKCLQNSSIIQNDSVTLQSVVISNVFVTCGNSPVKVQNICETTNFFMNYFLSRTGVINTSRTSTSRQFHPTGTRTA